LVVWIQNCDPGAVCNRIATNRYSALTKTTTSDRKRTKTNRIGRTAWVVLFILACLTCIAIRIRLLNLPLERDEGEYAYAGQLMLHGIAPYKLAYNMKFPGTYAAYAMIISLFGQTTVGIHLGLLLVNLATVGLVLLIGLRLVNLETGLAAATTYVVLAVNPAVMGLAAHATHFVVLFTIAGLLLLVGDTSSSSLASIFISGLLLGVAVLMKQPGIMFLILGFFWLLYRERKQPLPRLLFILAIFTFAAFLSLTIAIGAIWVAGTLRSCWFWCVQYARVYGTSISIKEGWDLFLSNVRVVIGECWPIWLLSAAGLVIALAKPGKFRPLFLVGLTIASALAVSMGLYFRPHYFVMLLPALSLFAGLAAAYAAATQQVITRVIALLVFAISVAFPIAMRAEYFFWMSPVDACRFRYGGNPFPEAIKVADFLRENSGPDEGLVVLGSEPEIYFYSRRQSATGFIYMYPLMEQQRFASQMQRQMIEEVETNRPGFVVWIWTPMSWRVAASSERLLFQWADQYLNDNYRPVGLVNMPPQAPTEYYLPIETADLQLAENFIIIFQRR
jgi:4-amino-4-deoxy-L-arabinose transferase-like glycosyltransferase